jgi:pilus assembly protein Flp/PilA
MQFILFTLLNIKARFEDLKQKESGATAVEYGLLVALIAAVIVGIVATLGGEIAEAFEKIVEALGGEVGGGEEEG